MPLYIANAYLSHKGEIVKPGEELELTEGQAKFLKEKVTAVEVEETADEGHTEESLKSMNADEQKEIVESLGGDLNELTNADKRIAYILENQ